MYQVACTLHLYKCYGSRADGSAGVTYYIEIGTDSNGVSELRCIRGTNALEGFHQKIRQLVRGFSLSPRLLICILHEFVYRWNVQAAVKARGLPADFSGWSDQQLVEENQAATDGWFDSVLDKEWASSRDFVPTNEMFGLAPGLAASSQQVHIVDQNLEESGFFEGMPASESWLAKNLNRKVPFKKVTGEDELAFFDAHYHAYTASSVGSNTDTSANSHSFIDFGLFADFWNTEADKQQTLPISDRLILWHKSAGLLQAHWKMKEEQSNERITLRPHRVAQHECRDALRSPVRANDVGEFNAPAQPEMQQPSQTSGLLVSPALDANGLQVHAHCCVVVGLTFC